MVASWLIIQVVSAVNTPLSLPEWFETVVVVLLAVGFPMALLFTWAFELTPEGIKLTPPDDAAAEQADGSKLDYILVGALVIVAAVTIWGQLPREPVDDLSPRGQAT